MNSDVKKRVSRLRASHTAHNLTKLTAMMLIIACVRNRGRVWEMIDTTQCLSHQRVVKIDFDREAMSSGQYNQCFRKYFCYCMACKAQKECIPLETDLDGFMIAFTWDNHSWEYNPTIKKFPPDTSVTALKKLDMNEGAVHGVLGQQMFQIMGPSYALDKV